MASLGERPWGKSIKGPVAVAAVVLVVAVWKTSNRKVSHGDDGERSQPGRGGSRGGSIAKTHGSGPGPGPGPDTGSGTGSGSCECECECHNQGANRTHRSNSHGEQPKPDGQTNCSVSNNPPERCCSCPPAIARAAAATALGRRSTGGGSLKSAHAGTPRRGRHDRRTDSNSTNGRQRRSRPRDGSSSSDKAAVGGAVSSSSSGPGATGRHASVAGGTTAAKAVVEGATLTSAAVLRRMARIPGPILRSGLVFEIVTALSMPGQGIVDGDIPESVARFAGVLRKVDLSGNLLTVVPPGLLELGQGLEDLNLGNNDIVELPPDISQLGGLLFFNMAGNRLTRLPAEVGRLSYLKRLGLKGNALVRLPPSVGDLSHLVELYLTGNILEGLPDEIVKLRRLKKLQLSFNNLRSLPQGMEAMRSLELCRIAVNPGLAVVPEGLLFAEKLAWVSLAGSAWCSRATEKRRRSSFPVIPRHEVVLGERLGSGASGDVFAGVYRGKAVAVKVFKSEVGPDGNARDELDVACAIDHTNLTKSLGVVRASNSNAKPSSTGGSSGTGGGSDVASGGGDAGGGDRDLIENLQWLVMERVVGRPLADKPDFSSVLRCRWGSGRRFEPVLVLAVLLQVARAMSYLHEKAICHGDLYAHNVLLDGETGATVLCDFGASFFYPKDQQRGSLFEGTEVRAFGHMSKDMACRSAGCEWILQDLVPSCLQADASQRPSFHEIVNQLHAELMQSVEPSSPMVTSAKSLHSLLDRPDIAAERVRVLSLERRQSTSSKPSLGEDAKSLPRGCGTANGSSSAVNSNGHDVDVMGTVGVGDNAGGIAGGIVGYRRGLSGGVVGGRGRGRTGVGAGNTPLVRLGGVEEGTADDEGDNDNEGGAKESEEAASAVRAGVTPAAGGPGATAEGSLVVSAE